MPYIFKTYTDPNLKLHQYRDTRADISIIIGPLGSGKTWASCEKIFRLMMEQDPDDRGVRRSRFCAIRNTYSELKTTTIRDWRELYDSGDSLGYFGKYSDGGSAPPSHKLDFDLPDGTSVDSELIFLALDRPDAIKKLRGLQITGFWLNEIKELARAVFEMAHGRTGRFPPKTRTFSGATWDGVIGDTNAPDDDHWLYKLAEEEKPEGWEFFIQPGGVMKELDEKNNWTGKWIVNPKAENLANLKPNYYSKQIAGKRTDWINVNLANNYGSVMDGKPIYKHQWSDGLHVVKNLGFIDNYPIQVGLDFGLTPAAIIGQQQPNGAVHVIEEIVADGMGIKQFAESLLLPRLNTKYRHCEPSFIGDPAGNRRSDTDEKTVFKELLDLGIECLEANTNDPTMRWEAVRYYLEMLRDGEPAFKLSDNCAILRKGFNGGYHFRRLQVAGDERYHEKADKNNFSHPHDALQYLMMYYRNEIKVVKSNFNRQSYSGSLL